MKKITLAFFGLFMSLTTVVFAQTYSTGLVQLSTEEGFEYSAKIDVTSSLVTLTMIGPENRWLGLGFRSTTQPYYMSAANDVVIFNGTDLTDRHFGYPGQPEGQNTQGIEPTLDVEQDWTIISNDVVSGVRTIVATRLPSTGNTFDYVFSAEATALVFVWARANYDTFSVSYHGMDSRGATMQSLTLSNDDVSLNDFKISPNPAKSKVTISLPNGATNLKLDVFDVLGKKVMTKNLSSLNSTFDVSKWNSGIYLMRITSDNGTQTKRFVKQ